MRAQSLQVFGPQLLNTDAISTIVSEPMDMIGNTVRLALNIYNSGGTGTALTVAWGLEGSVDGQFWEEITATTNGATPGALWGGYTISSAVNFTKIRVRVTITVAGAGMIQGQIWFGMGLAFTEQ